MTAPLDFLAVGHVTVDRLDSGRRLGGAAAYAALTASRLGAKAGIVTAAAGDFPFWSPLVTAGVEILAVPSSRSTAFDNRYRGGERVQRVLDVAAPIDGWRLEAAAGRLSERASVLYCPVVHEIPDSLTRLSRQGLTGVVPQGFFRAWSEDGLVTPRDWSDAEAQAALAGADIVCMSERDAPAPEALAEDFVGRAFIITRGAKGCRIYASGDIYDFDAFPADEMDPTGAGDVFAAAFLVAAAEGRSIPRAARFAAVAAALAVEGDGTSAIPNRSLVEARLG